MLAFLPKWLVGCIAWVLYWLNSFMWFIPIFAFALLKILPIECIRKSVSYVLDACASNWVKVNTLIQHLTIKTHLDVTGLDQLDKNDWYLVLANHQSWVDIMVVQRVLAGRVPFVKFFLKKELFYVPFFGLTWWALDFPFMVRYNKKFLRKNPHMKGKDAETTKKACEKFRYKPVSVMNFAEGTRFTAQKHDNQRSPFRFLLKPKAGGTALVLGAMEQMRKVIDVTIYYPKGTPTFWQYLSGKVDEIVVRINVESIGPEWVGDYHNDLEYRKQIQQLMNARWAQKDQLLAQLKLSHSAKQMHLDRCSDG